MQVSSAALRSRFAPHLLRKASEPSSRSRSNVLAAKRPGPVYASSSSSTLNKVLFTIPRTVQFGESLSVSGEGQELGSWNPNNSLPLKWNDGDLWAAEVPLPTGEKREYKYVVKDKNGLLKSWQPGENCAVEVPSEPDASLQVADDWFGKSRSVIYKNGEVQTAPAGTFDGPPTETSTATEPPAPVTQSVPGSSSQSQSLAEPSRGFFDVSPAPAQATVSLPSAQASGWTALGQPDAKQESLVENTLVDDETGVPFKELPVKTLQKRLRGRKQKVSGKKVDLVERLQSAEP